MDKKEKYYDKSKDAEKDGRNLAPIIQQKVEPESAEPSSAKPEARCECDDCDEMMSIDMDLDSLQEEYPNWIFSVKKAEHEENCPKSKEGAA